MRFLLAFTPLLGTLFAQPAQAAAVAVPPPFEGAMLTDADLAQVHGTGTPFRLTDDVAALSLRQTATLGATMRDLWLIDVASPLIAANVRAARD